MAYVRGDYYIWGNEDGVHFWGVTGEDGWRGSIWHVSAMERHKGEGVEPGGTWIPAPVVDQFVVMRLAELVEQGRFSEIAQQLVEELTCDSNEDISEDMPEEYFNSQGQYVSFRGRNILNLKRIFESGSDISPNVSSPRAKHDAPM